MHIQKTLNELIGAGHGGRTCRPRVPMAWAVAAFAAVCAGMAGCEKGDNKNAYVAPPPPEVIVATPTSREVVSYMNFTGVVEASATVDLRARVGGFLQKVNFQPGQRVKTGQLLFVIDKEQYQNAVDRGAAVVQGKEAALVGAENEARMARELADQRAGPEIDAVIKAAERDGIKADLEQAKSELANAKLNLSYCEVYAPMDGRITKSLLDPGNLVGNTGATVLAQIVQDMPAFVSIDASESDVLAVRRDDRREGDPKDREAGQMSPGKWRPCELALADQTEFAIKGRVDYVAPQLDAASGTLRVRTRYENEDQVLTPGLFAKVRFPMASRDAMLVPEAALLTDQKGRYALVVNAKDEVEVRHVKVGVLEGPMRVVEEGLAAEDRVVVLGVLKARPGSKVTPKTETRAPAPR